MTFLAPESDETRRFEYSQRRVATTDRDTLVVLEWAVEKARENLRRVYRMRADEECGPGTVEEAENWPELCGRALHAGSC